jgi:hypothetical protein
VASIGRSASATFQIVPAAAATTPTTTPDNRCPQA